MPLRYESYRQRSVIGSKGRWLLLKPAETLFGNLSIYFLIFSWTSLVQCHSDKVISRSIVNEVRLPQTIHHSWWTNGLLKILGIHRDQYLILKLFRERCQNQKYYLILLPSSLVWPSRSPQPPIIWLGRWYCYVRGLYCASKPQLQGPNI